MIQFECPRVRYPLVSVTFQVFCSVSLSLHTGKEKCGMCLANKVEIHFTKTGFKD